jgi:error-prone DNA polymerase
MTAYAELQVSSNFSFLSGASHPEELVRAAAGLGHQAVGITDHNTFAGIVRAHVAAREVGLRLVVGARLDLEDGASLLVFPTDRTAYGRLSRLLTLGKRRAPKGACHITRADVIAHGAGQIAVVLPPAMPGRPVPDDGFAAELCGWREAFGDRCYLAASHLYRGDDARRLHALADLAGCVRIPLVATNDVYAHDPARRPLQDVLTCIREGCRLEEAGAHLFANAERHLKSGAEMARLFARLPGAIERTIEIAGRAPFSLDELHYEYPDEVTASGRTAREELEHQTWAGAGARYGEEVPEKVRAQLEHELGVIDELGYAPYFLTVHDIVRFARGRGILCQGRGSAANSAVCYCLGITAVDPSRLDLLFERFVSAERGEPPDIDVDFEHERREEVIQYIYGKYGRERAGIAATVIRYRARSAIREVGKALGLSLDVVGKLAKTVWGWKSEEVDPRHLCEVGLDPTDRTLALATRLAREIIGFPRHLSQHVGGFVITRGPLSEVVPITNAAMAERTNVEWDKDDLDALGILKIDVLGLGMLTCLRKGFALLERHHGLALDLAAVPAEDAAVYDMLCKADSVGVFQVESRAQMSFLPRMKPRDFYDLVIQVAIVRPGPIQGDMVHPYLRRRNGEEKVAYPSEELRRVLGKTLGVPLFQEQAMRIAIVAAGFTPSEADALRRAMATFRKSGQIHGFRAKMVEGMVSRGYERGFAERCFSQIEGFGEYGFPESHAASFALLVYVSAWLKCHYPAAFACALLNSQPMGFYAPAQIVRDAREHGVGVRPVDVNHSAWDCILEPAGAGGVVALRLGFRQIKGFYVEDAVRLLAARGRGYGDVPDLWRRSGLGRTALEHLAEADTHGSMGLDRRAALWAVRGLGPAPLTLFQEAATEAGPEPAVKLPEMTLGDEIVSDYACLRLTLRAHPLALLREVLTEAGITPAAGLARMPAGRRVSVAGLVLVRQRPGSAKGVIFATLEDETGLVNAIIWPSVFECNRRAVLGSTLLCIDGVLQREGIVIHIIARQVTDLSHLLASLADGPAGHLPHAIRRAAATTDEAPRMAAPARRDFPSRDFH